MSLTIPEKLLPTIAIVGRTNVGKSTFFNRLLEQKKALVSTIAGTTRTSNVGIFKWRGKKYRLIDTGGIDFTKDSLEKEIHKQIATAFKEADLVVFLVDLKQELMPQENEWAKELRNIKIPVFLVGNKADNTKLRARAHNSEWLRFGFGEPFPVSSSNGSGIGDCLDIILEKMNKKTDNSKLDLKHKPIKISLIGRPNVGKSTLFNAIIGEDRVVTSPVAHTTRESHDVLVILDDKPYVFVDTAGIRKKSKIDKGLEEGGVNQAITSIENSDVSLLVLDATEPFTAQDKHLIQVISTMRKGVIIIINKWDLVPEKNTQTQVIITKQLFTLFPPLAFAPVVFVSALTHKNVPNLFPLIEEVNDNCHRILEEKELAHFMESLIKRKLPTRGKGVRHPKIYALRQKDVTPPTFEVTIKQKTSLHENYLKFIENNLRKSFNFEGSPVVVYVRKIRV